MEIKITTKKAEVNITCSAEELVIISQQPAFKEFTDLLLDHAKWESAFQRKRMSSRLDVNEHHHDDCDQESVKSLNQLFDEFCAKRNI